MARINYWKLLPVAMAGATEVIKGLDESSEEGAKLTELEIANIVGAIAGATLNAFSDLIVRDPDVDLAGLIADKIREAGMMV